MAKARAISAHHNGEDSNHEHVTNTQQASLSKKAAANSTAARAKKAAAALAAASTMNGMRESGNGLDGSVHRGSIGNGSSVGALTLVNSNSVSRKDVGFCLWAGGSPDKNSLRGITLPSKSSTSIAVRTGFKSRRPSKIQMLLPFSVWESVCGHQQ
jgi:hypothetical protein